VVKHAQGALNMLAMPTPELEAYRLEIMYTLARAEMAIGGAGELKMAEDHLGQVVKGRVEPFGFAHTNEDAFLFVWEAVDCVRDVMVAQGRHEEALEWRAGFAAQSEAGREAWWQQHARTASDSPNPLPGPSSTTASCG
jgi:hypothetical protein